MHGVLKDRLWRKLEALPEERLYQVLDYIEFLESRYAERPAPAPGGMQRFAERFEDNMRVHRVAPKVIMGTMRVMGAAARVVDGVTATGRELLRPPAPATRSSSVPTRTTGETSAAAAAANGARTLPASSETKPTSQEDDGEVEH